jgi:16S rRNA U516 pseudouridylate synthase RsuA-like enzyme
MRVERRSPRVLRFILEEGRKHQIRRVCRRVGLRVEDLFREAVGPFRIGDLPEGLWRPAVAEEMEALRESKNHELNADG